MTLANRGPGEIQRPKAGVSVSSRTVTSALPIVRVVQDQSGDGTAGKFRRVDTGEEFDVLEGTPLLIQEGRIKWPQPFQGKGSPPECWSGDMVTAAPGAMYAGRECSKCEFLFNGCDPMFGMVFFRLPERQELLLQLTGGMTRAVGALIGENTVREKLVRIGTQKVRGKLGAWFTLMVDTKDMQPLPPDTQIFVERYFRERYLGEAQQPSVPVDVLTPDGVDPDTGEILDSKVPCPQCLAEDYDATPNKIAPGQELCQYHLDERASEKNPEKNPDDDDPTLDYPPDDDDYYANLPF